MAYIGDISNQEKKKNSPSKDNGNVDEKCTIGVQDESTGGTVITEGKARVRFPGAKDDVFYNPVQEFNRDLR